MIAWILVAIAALSLVALVRTRGRLRNCELDNMGLRSRNYTLTQPHRDWMRRAVKDYEQDLQSNTDEA